MVEINRVTILGNKNSECMIHTFWNCLNVETFLYKVLNFNLITIEIARESIWARDFERMKTLDCLFNFLQIEYVSKLLIFFQGNNNMFSQAFDVIWNPRQTGFKKTFKVGEKIIWYSLLLKKLFQVMFNGQNPIKASSDQGTHMEEAL